MTSPPAIPEGLQVFLDHAKSLQPSKNPRRENGFAREFQQIKEFSSQLKRDKAYCSLHGELDYNRSKNRYKDIVPFDDTRIKLPTVSGLKGSDYINGNYIKGPDGSISYLAVQGPLPRTVNDFWRLIASHKIEVVIMVCKEIEMGKLKCKRYWPENTDEKLNFAGLEISLVDEQDVGDGFIIRTMQMKSVKEKLQVTQLHYTAWPDHDVPESPAPLIELNKTLRAVVGKMQQQVLVHCSAGCGRTGTICAVDYAWGLLKLHKTDNFSVFDIVKNLRRQRMAMVQTKEQYELVYKAVVQLVEEELEQTRLKSHTYVNVEVPAHQSSGRGDYENCELAESVNRWKNGGDSNNGAVNKPVPPLPTPKPQITENKIISPPPVKPASDQSYENCAIGPPPGGSKSTVPTAGSKVNRPPVPAVRPTSPVKESDGVTTSGFKKPPPAVRNRNSEPDLHMEKGTVPPAVATKKSPTAAADYEVLPMSLVPGSRQSPPGPGDYEIPPLLKNFDKKQVPEGLLIDLESEGPPLPIKRHSGCKDDQQSTSIEGPRLLGADGKRSSSSPNVLVPTMLSGGGKAQQLTNNTLLDIQSHKISDGFHTLPSMKSPVCIPARPRLTGSTFEDLSPSNTGLIAIHSPKDKDPKGQYFLVGAALDTPPKSGDQNKARPFTLQLHRGTGPEKGKPTAEGHVSPQFKETVDSKPKLHSPVGAYALVGIPDIGTRGNTSSESVHITTPLQNPEHLPYNAATGEPLCNLDGQRQPMQHKSSPSVQPYSGNMVSGPHTAAAPTAGAREQASLYAVVEDSAPRKEPQQKLPHAPPKLQKDSSQFSKSVSSPDTSLRGQADGEAVIVQDLYATVAPRVKDSGPNLHPQTSSGSLQSFTSLSSDELDEEAPPIPVKTDDAFLAPGENAYDTVEQTSSSTLDRFKKRMKTPSKGSFLKRLSPDQSMSSFTPSSLPAQSAAPPTNSPVTPVNCTLESLGYLKRVAKPVGPRACPKNWPSLVHLGL